jgi:SP family arabinose:H+ symporter-like MFS transporter
MKYNMKFVWAIALISAMGGLLFGYDWVLIGGAKPFYEQFFKITNFPFLQGWAMSSALAGCFIGAAISGILSDRYGRKRLLILAGFFFVISGIGTGAAKFFNAFIIYRILGGIGIGLASNLSPMYIAEISPPEQRGRFVSINQLTIVIGILLAQITNWLIAQPVSPTASDIEILNSWNGQYGWRWMFWAESIPATIFFVLMFFVPESPRWLAKSGNNTKAFSVLERLAGTDNAGNQLNSILATLKESTDKINFRELFQKGTRKVLIIGVVLAIFQQWCGINVIFNYAEEVFKAAGYNVSDMLLNIVITGSVNLIFTFIAIKTVDNWGRRTLMLIGAGGLAGIYALMGAAFYLKMSGFPVLILVISAIACYSMSLAPVTWVVLSEIFPNRIRGAAMSVSTMALWFACFVLTYTFPILNHGLKAFGTFWLYGIICAGGLIFIFKKLPETKRKSLEEIEKFFKTNNNEIYN